VNDVPSWAMLADRSNNTLTSGLVVDDVATTNSSQTDRDRQSVDRRDKDRKSSSSPAGSPWTSTRCKTALARSNAERGYRLTCPKEALRILLAASGDRAYRG
jgi:hypothetical protein